MKRIVANIPKSVIIIFFGLVLFLPFLGSFELTAITEGEYSGVAREMVQKHDFISLYFNNEFWADKPPLHLWLLALFGTLGKWSEFSLRLPGVLMTILIGLLIYLMGKKFITKRAGFLAALIFFTNIETIVSGQIVFVDMTFTFFTTVALYNFMMFFHNGENKISIYSFFAACAGAVMTKGLIGILIPAGGALGFFIWHKKWDIILKHTRDLLIGLGIFLLLTSPWYIMEIIFYKDTFIQRFFTHFNIERFTKGVDNANPWFYYLIIMPITLFPWSSFLKNGFFALKQIENKIFTRSLASLSIFTIIFFSISVTKLHTYLLPLYPFWSLLFAHGWDYNWEHGKRATIKSFSGSLIVFPLTLIVLIVASLNVDGHKITHLMLPTIIAISITLCLVIVGSLRKMNLRNSCLVLIIGMVFVMNLNIKGYIMPYMQNHFMYVKDFSLLINSEYHQGDKIATTTRSSTSLVFYTQKKVDYPQNIKSYFNQKAKIFLIIPAKALNFPAKILGKKSDWILITNKW